MSGQGEHQLLTWCAASEPKEGAEGQPEVGCWSPSGLRKVSMQGGWPTVERQDLNGKEGLCVQK